MNKQPISKPITKTTQPKVLAEAVFLGCDLHSSSISVCRAFDSSNAQPTQKMSWEACEKFILDQRALAKRVYVLYEAGAFGFWFCRKLRAQGIECIIMHPEKLDPRQKRVQTDKTDARQLVEKLRRYVHGNEREISRVHLPTEQEERSRLETRHRRFLFEKTQGLRARGRGLLLSQGIFKPGKWWRNPEWKSLTTRISEELRACLEDLRLMILENEKRIVPVVKKITQAAPKELPAGFGKLTFVMLMRDICNFNRFKNHRQVGGFMGLCGGVSSSGTYHRDLNINKAGSPYLRALLVELAWRMTFYQPNYRPVKRWFKELTGHKRAKKRAIIAIARQLAVDIWRWQTGRVTPEQLGWIMKMA